MKKTRKGGVNKKYLVLGILGLILIASLSIFRSRPKQTSLSITTGKNLVGVWQNSPSMAAGWSDRFHFYSDGTFDYVSNSMSCDQQIRQVHGKWSYGLDALELDIGEKLFLVSKNNVDGSIPCGADRVYEVRTREEDELEVTDHPEITDDDLGVYLREKITIDGPIFLKENYWKFDNDPNVDKPAPIGTEKMKFSVSLDDYPLIEKAIKKEISYADKIEVKKLTDKFARAVVLYKEGDGDDYILVKVNGIWKIATTDAQAVPNCSDLDKYQVPKVFYKSCFYAGAELRKGDWL